MKRKIVLYTNWENGELKCACSFFNPMCEKFKTCEELEVKYNPYEDIEECMGHRSYKKVNGVIKQR